MHFHEGDLQKPLPRKKIITYPESEKPQWNIQAGTHANLVDMTIMFLPVYYRLGNIVEVRVADYYHSITSGASLAQRI